MAQSSGEIGRASTSDDIRSQIEQTRAEMTDTIDAIQARLSPRRLATNVKERVFTPIPAAVAGAATTAVLLRALYRSRNGHEAEPIESTEGFVVHGRRRSNGISRHKARIVTGLCAGLACCAAWQARRSAAQTHRT